MENSMASHSYAYVVPVRVSGTTNTFLCRVPNAMACSGGDRVITAASSESAKYAHIEGVCLSAPKLVDAETLWLLETVYSEQFPLRKVLAKYNIEPFSYNDEGEVLNAEQTVL